jgi:Spy/CpxP family protein refolding chaperone
MNLIIFLLISVFPQHRSFWKLVENPRVAEELALSEDQVKEMEDILYETSEKLLNIRSEREIKELKLRRTLKEDSPDPETVERLVKEIGELKTKERLSILRENLRIRKILSKEQWKKFQKMRKKFRKPRRRFAPRAKARARRIR